MTCSYSTGTTKVWVAKCIYMSLAPFPYHDSQQQLRLYTEFNGSFCLYQLAIMIYNWRSGLTESFKGHIQDGVMQT